MGTIEKMMAKAARWHSVLLLLCALVALEAAEQLIALDDSSITPDATASAGANAEADATSAAVKVEGDEKAEKAQAASAEAQAGNATVKVNKDTCQMRQATIQLKLDDAEKSFDTLGLKYMRLISGIKMYASHIASGEAQARGTAKFHRLAYENAQRRLGRSPAKEMTAKITIKVGSMHKRITKLDAQLADLRTQVSNATSRVEVLHAKMDVVTNQIEDDEHKLELETGAHKQGFELELKTLGDTNARRKHHMEQAEKVRAAKIAKKKKAISIEMNIANAELARLTPELKVVKAKASDMAKRRKHVLAENKKRVAMLSQSLKSAKANVGKELARKAKHGIASKKGRTIMNHLEREQTRIKTGV